MKRILTIATAMIISLLPIRAQELRPEVFDLLDLDYPGLETVRNLHNAGDDEGAAQALLDYYRGRTGIKTPEIQDISRVKINKEQQKWADDALEHTFYVHKGYQPSFNYGEDIDWRYWPVHDNELRWQLHRHYWFTPMGYAYRVSGDEKYAKEWVFEYMDWIRKNPLVRISKSEYEIDPDSQLAGDAENTRFAWRPLEVSHRVQDQCLQFQLFIDSPNFTKEFLTEFLVNYHRHADFIIHNYSKQGNHLLFESQRIIYAGAFFPEFKEAKEWLDSGIEILNREINVQVYDDGGQYELDPGYHLASIDIFLRALQVADLNGFRDAFPKSYIDTVEKMIVFYANLCYPDYSTPLFSDTKSTNRDVILRNYQKWNRIYPENKFIEYLATEGREGERPDYLSKGFLTTGFFVFRSGWDNDAVQMVVKAGPKGEWHSQPDNGTFELWYNGKALFQDSGSYVYAGDAAQNEERNWFRATAHHNTLSFGNKDLQTRESKTLLWQPEGDVQILVTENPSYKQLTHRRSIFFVDNTYFVIVDEAVGDAKGWVNLHYQMPRGEVPNSREDMTFYTNFEDGSNMMLQCFGPEGMSMKKDKGWISTAYNKKVQRIDASFNVKKENGEPVRYITIIYPKENAGHDPSMSAKFIDKGYHENGLRISVKVGKEKKRTLEYSL